MEIIIATGNAGKVREFKRMLEPLGYQVFSQKEKGIILDVEETGTTFAENAVRKAKAVWEKVKLPVIADDSGLCVDALDGRPGIYSARYAGEGATDADRVKSSLRSLRERKIERDGSFAPLRISMGRGKPMFSKVSARARWQSLPGGRTASATTLSSWWGRRPSPR